MATATAHFDEERDFAFPQREAAFFYGLFLRGHSAEQLRRDIKVPVEVIQKWSRDRHMLPEQRALLDRILEYRGRVLAIFDSLVGREGSYHMIQ
jgi:hypothetical protein